MKKAHPTNPSSMHPHLSFDGPAGMRPIRHRTAPMNGRVRDTERFLKGAYYATSTIHPVPRPTKDGARPRKFLG